MSPRINFLQQRSFPPRSPPTCVFNILPSISCPLLPHHLLFLLNFLFISSLFPPSPYSIFFFSLSFSIFLTCPLPRCFLCPLLLRPFVSPSPSSILSAPSFSLSFHSFYPLPSLEFFSSLFCAASHSFPVAPFLSPRPHSRILLSGDT